MVKDKTGFKRLIKPENAINLFFKKIYIKPIGVEKISIYDALNRVLAEDIVSNTDIPPFNRAAMDGYAVRACDVSGASENNPIRLRIVGEVKTGMPFKGRLGEGEAVRIDTGAEMPENADTVVMLEHTRREGDYVDIYKSVAPYQNVALRGEDIREGMVIVRSGTLLTPYDLAAIASLGYIDVKVYRKPVVGIASIGDELVEIGSEPEGSKIIEVNRLMVKGILKNYPVKIRDYGILGDDISILKKFYQKAANENDIVITMGGTSMGKGDYVVEALGEVGEVIVHGVALFPSRPVALARINNKPILGLPGYPVAVAISMYIFGDAILNKMCGIEGIKITPRIRGKLTRRAPSKLGLKHYIRGKIKVKGGNVFIEPVITAGAGIISSLSLSDGFIIVPEYMEGFERGEEVEIEIFRRYIKSEEDV